MVADGGATMALAAPPSGGDVVLGPLVVMADICDSLPLTPWSKWAMGTLTRRSYVRATIAPSREARTSRRHNYRAPAYELPKADPGRLHWAPSVALFMAAPVAHRIQAGGS